MPTIRLSAVLTALVALGGSVLTAVPAGSAVSPAAAPVASSSARDWVVGGREARRAPADQPLAHRLRVMVVDNRGDQTIADAALKTMVSDVADYWVRQSNGRMGTTTVHPTVTHYNSSRTGSECGLTDRAFFEAVDEAESKIAGFDPDLDQVVVFVPGTCASGSRAGMAVAGGSFDGHGGTIVKQSESTPAVIAHEIGHTLGFGHANIGWCVDGTPDCFEEYAGAYEVMAAAGRDDGTTALGTAYREAAGITDAGEVATLSPTSQQPDASVTLRARTAASGVRGVKVVDPDSGTTYYLDLRTGQGEDVGACYGEDDGCSFDDYRLSKGVTVSRPRHDPTAPAAAAQPQVDFQPIRPHGNGLDDLAIGADEPWTVPLGNLTITVSEMDDVSATVAVHYIALPAFDTVGKPTISGSAEYDDPDGLTAAIGTGWSPAATNVTYEWIDPDGDIVATGATYRPSGSLVGQDLRVRATVAAPGRRPTRSTSDPVRVTGASFTFTQAPAITPATTSAVGKVLRVTSARTSPSLFFPSIDRQWYADGVAIPGATETTFRVRAVDAGRKITVGETWRPYGYEPGSSRSKAVGVAGKKIPLPTIAGKPRVGVKLVAGREGWSAPSGTVWTYAWFADGVAVPGATKSGFKPTADQVGRAITVRVTATAPKKPGESLTSAPTKPVKPAA